MDTQIIVDLIISSLMPLEEITAAGLTGKLDADLKPGESDIDIFVFCKTIPKSSRRLKEYEKLLEKSLICDLQMDVYEGGDWGIGDCLKINNVETWLMYFTENETAEYLDAVISGTLMDSDNGFYPTGRCATIQNMIVLQDKTGFINTMQKKVQNYPESLRLQLTAHHLQLCFDEEDFGRAALRRDVLFYHQVLENALDHFLQALFALNRIYFPSRKRTLEYIESFKIKPIQCADKLKKAVELGSKADGIAESCRIWNELAAELRELIKNQGLKK